MSAKALVNSAHQPGCTCIAFARDGSRVYTGGIDSLVRIWRTDLGANQEPDAAIDAAEGITALTTGRGYWFSGSSDSEVRRYAYGKTEFEGLVTNAIGVPIRCVAVDPQSARIAVTSDEPTVKVIDIEDTTNISVLGGHTKAVRKATWHPSGSLLTTCGADGKIIIWDVSEGQCKEEKAIEGIIPAVANADSEEFAHDCSAIWHTSGQYFFVATRAHEVITISRSDWTKSSTFVDDALSGAITALALSNNGVYLACACKAGVFIWSTETRRLLYRYDGKQTATITQMAFSPSQNLLAWTDMDGVLTRWAEPIPATAPDPVKLAPGTASMTVPVKRKAITMLFDDEADAEKAKDDELDVNETVEVDYENDDWILDDLGGAMDDDNEEKKWSGKDGVKEMVSVTKAQPPFQPGSTPMENKKRYLVYNMIGVIEVTDQDTHHIVNVEFHDKSARKGYHFTDHFKYDLASLGERGAVYACRPEQEHPARVTFKPYGTWATQGEWTYELPKGTRVLGVAAGGAPSSGSRRDFDSDLQGNGNVVIATSANELIFMTGTGIERQCLSLQGDFVSMVAGPEWVFVVHRDGATTMDGSQNLTGRLIKFDDFCLLQKDTLPIPKKCTLKWIGITEEGAPAIYDSAGILNIMPRYRAPFSATWTRVLDTNLLERREGKQESYWPIGVAADNLMCLILKGRQEHPGFPRPLIQELPLRLPFHHLDPKEAPLEEHFARESMMLDILRDGLGDELTTDDIFRRELALDKELVQLIQLACKNDRLTRAVDLTRLLHHTSSFDMAIKVAAFYHLVGLQEKMEALKEEREATDLLANSRDRRRQRAKEFLPVPATVKMPTKPSRPRAFQDFKPPSPKHRPGLERATPVIEPKTTTSASFTENYSAFGSSLIENDGGADDSWSSPSSKRKRSSEEDEPAREFQYLGADSSSKRRNLDETAATVKTAAARSRGNPFARKSGNDTTHNLFTKSAETNKSLHKNESFFNKVDAAESGKAKRLPPAKGKTKEKKNAGRQTTLFGLPFAAPSDKPDKKASAEKIDNDDTQESQDTEVAEQSQTTAIDTQETDVMMYQPADAGGQAMETMSAEIVEQEIESSEHIDWPASPVRETSIIETVTS